jgi:hypothetical protein
MSHSHVIIDTDKAFTIDPVSKMITKVTDAKVTIMQFDHNSERLTFSMPLEVEGHDMSKTDKIEVHFINSGTGTSVSNRATHPGIYRIKDKDKRVIEGESSTFEFSWLVGEESTQLAGALSFLVKFICEGEGESGYKWHTHPCTFINIPAGMNNSDEIVNAYPDVIAEIEKRLEAMANNEELDARFTRIESQIADLMYKPITINSFTNSVGTVEIGTTVNKVTLNWSLSKTPKTITLNGKSLDIFDTTWTVDDLGLTTSVVFTLAVTDERDTKATDDSRITFLNGVYYGATEAPSKYDSEFILGLTKTLRSNKLPSFTANAGSTQHIYYALPSSYGACTFSVGGFTGGFELVDTISFTNASGYSENYRIYKSVNAGLGNTTVSVT